MKRVTQPQEEERKKDILLLSQLLPPWYSLRL